MTKDEILTMVKSVLTGAFELPEAKLVPEAQLNRDLDLDSLDAVDLVIKLKSDIGVVLNEKDLRSIRTIGDIVDIIFAALNPSPPDEK